MSVHVKTLERVTDKSAVSWVDTRPTISPARDGSVQNIDRASLTDMTGGYFNDFAVNL